MITSIFHKKHEAILIPANAYTCTTYKHASFRSYLNRAHKYCSLAEDTEKEIKWIKKQAIEFGYPEKLIDKLNDKIKNKRQMDETTVLNRLKEPTKKLKFGGSLPFNKFSLCLKRRLAKIGVDIAITNNPSIFALNRKDQDSLNKLNLPCIYSIPLDDGESIFEYIGSTKRSLTIRLAEHKKLYDWAILNNFSVNSTLVNFAQENNLIPCWNLAKPVAICRNINIIKIREAIEIFIKKPINEDYLPVNLNYSMKSLLDLVYL